MNIHSLKADTQTVNVTIGTLKVTMRTAGKLWGSCCCYKGLNFIIFEFWTLNNNNFVIDAVYSSKTSDFNQK